MSRDLYSDYLGGSAPTAHSGPELASCVPSSELAQDIARTLLSDHVELTYRSFSSSPVAAGFNAVNGTSAFGLIRK